MKLDKKTVRTLLFIIVFAVLFTAVILNIGTVWSAFLTVLGVFAPVTVGFCAAFILNVPLRFVENKLFAPLNRRQGALWKKVRRPLSIVLSFCIVIGLVALLLGMIIPQLVRAVELVARELPGWAHDVSEWARPFLETVGIDVSEEEPLINWSSVSGMITDFLNNASQSVSTALSVTSQVIGSITTTVLGLIFSVYVLVSKEKLAHQAKRLLYAVLNTESAHTVMRLCSMSFNAFSNFFGGQCTEALILGCLVFAGMNIFGFPNALMVAALTGTLALLPIFGAFLSAVTGVFIILIDDPVKAMWYLVFIVVLQQLEGNLIYPRVMGNAVGLPGIWVLAAVTVGGNVAGVVGMLAGVPLASVLYTLLREFVWDRLKTKLADARSSGDDDTERSISEVMKGETPSEVHTKQKRSLLSTVIGRLKSRPPEGDSPDEKDESGD